MIAAAWSPSGRSKAGELLAHIERAVRSSPRQELQQDECSLASWDFGAGAKIDCSSKVAWIGSPRVVPDRIELRNAGSLGGPYALIAKVPEGLLVGCGSLT